MKIGLTYIKGSLPGFETFGNLPTDIVKSNGLVNGIKAHKTLDAIIIPGGSIVESESISKDLAIEVKKIAHDGKFVLGICSGFQALSNKTDVGRKSPCPIEKKGIGLLDVNFSPLISNDHVEAYTKNDSFLTHGITNGIKGFHCHTYGKIENNETAIMYSKLKRVNYSNTNTSLLSGVRNSEGNVIGTMVHGILDNNIAIVNNVFKYLDANEKDIEIIYNKNKELLNNINNEIAIDSGINALKLDNRIAIDSGINTLKLDNEIAIDSGISTLKLDNGIAIDSGINTLKLDNGIANSNNLNLKDSKDYLMNIVKFVKSRNKGKNPLTLMIGSTGSDSGKTFITTGLAGLLKKLGLNVAILKIGPDIRDTVPGLYLTKGLMEGFASIKIGHLGWMDIENVLNRLKSSKYDFILIEGAMSLFIGILKDIIPYSGAEIAISSNIPLLLVGGVNKGGIESTAIDLVYHAKILKGMGIDIGGIVLNKIYDQNIFDKVKPWIQSQTDIYDVIAIPKIKLEDRGSTPELEINLEDFSLSAMDTVEKCIAIEKVIKMAKNPKFKGYLSYDEIKNIFSI